MCLKTVTGKEPLYVPSFHILFFCFNDCFFWWEGRRGNVGMYRAQELKLISAVPEEKIFVTGRAAGA